VDVLVLVALAEPNRLRIVELLHDAPRPVGEIAAGLGLRQPQVTKHLQTLERAGLVRAHALGQRRVYALRRAPLAELERWAAGLAAEHPSEAVLTRYESAVASETRRLVDDQGPRVLRLRRLVAAPPEQVWAAWTQAGLVRRWWSPQHLHVARCTVQAKDGGRLLIVLAEGDGTEHRASGRFTELVPVERIGFELAPEGPDGRPVFRVAHAVRLVPDGERTIVTLRLRAFAFEDGAAATLAGLRIGWEQTLDRLAALFSA
jgi:uncharacterized protein YndB with AHSA1/START domain